MNMYQINLNEEQHNLLNVAIELTIENINNCAKNPVWDITEPYIGDGALKLGPARRQLEDIKTRVFDNPLILKGDQELEIINYTLKVAALHVEHLANNFVWNLAGIKQDPQVREMKERSQHLANSFRNIQIEIITQS